jgi:phosphatidate phosphatase APP1
VDRRERHPQGPPGERARDRPAGDRRWAAALVRALTRTEGRLDALKYRLADRRAERREPVIQPFRGYGRRDRLWLMGRVLREPRIPASAAGDPLWRILLAAWRRFESDEVPGARVRATAAGASVDLEADEEGYFSGWLEPRRPLPAGKRSVEVELELLDAPAGSAVRATGEVLLAPATARFAVVSDIDDTVVPTEAGRLLRMARNTLLHNAHSRVPFPGVAAFYGALAAGRGAEGNPFLYVSSGPWNLYDLLLEAFRLHGMPPGAVVLRDWGLSAEGLLPTRHRHHKLAAIRQALEVWSELPFLLVGDSGQQDPEIYREVAGDHPERVLAVYIRNVSRDLARPAAIGRLAAEVAEAGGTLLLAPTAWELASHAAERGWITADSLPAVAAALAAAGGPEPSRPSAAKVAAARAGDAAAAATEPAPPEARVAAEQVQEELQTGEGDVPPAVKVEPGPEGPEVTAVETGPGRPAGGPAAR